MANIPSAFNGRTVKINSAPTKTTASALKTLAPADGKGVRPAPSTATKTSRPMPKK